MLDVFVVGGEVCPYGLLPKPGAAWLVERRYPGVLEQVLRMMPDALADLTGDFGFRRLRCRVGGQPYSLGLLQMVV